MRSDAFQSEFERRRMEMDDELKSELVRTNFMMSIKANEQLMKYMDEPIEKQDPRVLLDAASATADRYYGPRPSDNANNGNTNVFVIDGTVLDQARNRIRTINHGQSQETQEALPAPTDTESN